MIAVSTFRGYQAISDLIGRMEPLANWLCTYRPSCKVLTLRRRDLDLVLRCPQAASVLGFMCVEGRMHWRGFELRADRSPSRPGPPYRKGIAP